MSNLKFGNIHFEHEGKKVSLHWSENPLTTGIMYWFSNSSNMYGGATMRDIKNMKKNIIEKKIFLSEDNEPNHILNGKI